MILRLSSGGTVCSEGEPILYGDEVFNSKVRLAVNEWRETDSATLLEMGEEYLTTYELYKLLEGKLKKLSTELNKEL